MDKHKQKNILMRIKIRKIKLSYKFFIHLVFLYLHKNNIISLSFKGIIYEKMK